MPRTLSSMTHTSSKCDGRERGSKVGRESTKIQRCCKFQSKADPAVANEHEIPEIREIGKLFYVSLKSMSFGRSVNIRVLRAA
jgi:hypothetical protein